VAIFGSVKKENKPKGGAILKLCSHASLTKAGYGQKEITMEILKKWGLELWMVSVMSILVIIGITTT